MARGPVDDPYVYPGTLTLKNKLGITDAGLLRAAEYAYTRQRTADAPPLPLTPDGFKATHKHLFGDVFPWAGQVRTVGITHPRHQEPFAFPHLIEGSLAKQFRELAANGNLVGLDAASFAEKAAHHVGELNAIHAFRDGNGRTMRLHLKQLAAGAGHDLDIARLPGKAWNDASGVSFRTADPRPLAAVIVQGLGSRERPEVEAAQAAATLSPDGLLVYAALAEKIDREMVKLTLGDKAEMRRFVADELVRREAREGPVVLTPEQRQLAAAPIAPTPAPGADVVKPELPSPPDRNRRR
ncbi:hypothetical protein HN018_28160 (plasmid) [Lichenicola cladoniae]|uniref:protein adenylyltransferase n=1 Tax=Lichenicola cladoniae TaxID=1484109 RepID=A0A6M8I0D4_9PROT|nr:Fic family protein [Lichenicola cladoniae]NPD70344.1 hypothetical protein [Acetobacteraceae bacterium]QKE94000.1 hypothetical protein HN018_28160 [Lichenicola cladoniae]